MAHEAQPPPRAADATLHPNGTPDADRLITRLCEARGLDEYGPIAAELVRLAEAATGKSVETNGNGPHDAERDKIIRVERYRHDARSVIATEEAREAMTLPATPAERSLDDRLRDFPEPVPFHITDLARRHHNVVLAAQYKTGKTSIAAERVRAEVDGIPFLGSFATRRIDGNVGFWNNELEAADMNDYFRDLGIANRKKILIEDLKGFRVPLLHDVGAEWAIKWLRSREVESWYLDPWRSVCSWSGVNEYLDPEVAPLIDRIDAIKREAGIAHVHINHHCGARDLERPRGASTLADWADAIWTYVRESERRYLKAIGRGVELAEGVVELDGTGRLAFREGSRREQVQAEARDQLVAYVEEHPGCTTGMATDAIDAAGAPTRQKAVNTAKERGLIIERKKGTAKLLYPANHTFEDELEVESADR